ncbi:hypothetical protein PRZ48_011522 [Zasmidium cellare]|uniref:Heterokaryon incompatibility domain-containing protein n=1 Tax=Zasmidium cellare TaxID=395010 RepID=A0ABR0E6K8_ZASCE|nr:hypothetical protein PRZ48_011522 [Zasmidium cellare]
MYKHELLSRPKEEIRLLRIEDGLEDDEIAVTLQTWNLNDTPDYYAVSYTWGEELSQIISVNGQSFPVRRNCHYALWQVRLHHPGEFIWIDSICINQDDPEERKCQVSIMEKIYTRALWTLACIGPHENNSEILVRSLKQMKDINRKAAQADGVSVDDIDASVHDPGGYLYRRRWHPWVHGLDEGFLIDFRKSLVAFARRAYWTRLWIVQEVAMPKGRGQLFFGNAVFSWGDIELILQLIGGGENDQGFLTATPTALWGDDGLADVLPAFQVIESLWRFDTNLYIDSVLSATFASKCSDPRDHIYGVLCLIQWKQGQTPIVPDYTRSPVHLAMEAVAHMRDIAVVPLLFHVLGVHHAHVEMQDLFAHRVGSNITTPGSSTLQSLRDTEVEFKLGYNHMVRCAEILLDQSGCLTVAAMRDELPEKIEQERDQLAVASRLLDGDQKPLILKCNAEDVAIASRNTQAGDVILPISPLSHSTPSFITLRSNDVSFDIVGQGFFLPGFDILKPTEGVSLSDDAKRSTLDAEMVLTLTVADIMRLVGQDFVDLGTYSPEARVRRLATNAVDRPAGAVAPLFIQEYWSQED